MTVTAVVGTQWGDEGKGRVIDWLSFYADMVIRFQGGDNAGHTVIDDEGNVFKLHIIPCALIREGKQCLVGPGVVNWLPVAADELQISREKGSIVTFDESAPIIMPIHRALDAARELASGKSKIGTTKRGIGPVYSDFWLRRGLRMGDFRSRAKVESILNTSGYFDELVATMRHLRSYGPVNYPDLGFNIDPLSFEQTVRWIMVQADQFVDHLGDTRQMVHSAIDEGLLHLLFEGAQGEGLDGYHGQRRNRTASLCGRSGIGATFGVYYFDEVYGVMKGYPTSVGARIFPTILNGDEGEKLRKKGKEYGATTGRPRDCGRLDLKSLGASIRLGGITKLAVTKLDVLAGLGDIPVCDEYKNGVGNVPKFAALTDDVLEQATPVYSVHPGWSDDISKARSFEDLPKAAQDYLHHISNKLGVPISFVSVGAERSAMFAC